MGAEITLVLGGARSGKSEVAERIAPGLGHPVTYVATGDTSKGDPDWAERVERHRARRPADWPTVELERGGDLGALLAGIDGVALVDSLGTWVGGFPEADVGDDATQGLCAALASRRASGLSTILVSDEVGMGVHPSTAVGLVFRDALGALNRSVAETADGVLLVVAGRVLRLEPPEGSP